MDKRKIILDCDPGHDDAVAIMLCGNSSKIVLLGVTVVAGNQTIEKTTINALNLAQYFNLEVPVSKGCGKPLIKEPMICSEIHGESGLDGFTFPTLHKQVDKRSAVELTKELLIEHKNVTLVATGPLTNVASLLIKYPECKPHIDEIVLMGGSIGHGNVTPAAEFNILVDPEAAEIVFNSGLKITMMGLDVTRKVKILNSIIDDIEKINNRASKLFVDLMRTFNINQKEVFGFEGAPLHDPVTIAYLINKDVVKLQSMNVEIDVSKGPSYGRTNCDQFDFLKRSHNAKVAIDIDVDKYFELIKTCIKGYK